MRALLLAIMVAAVSAEGAQRLVFQGVSPFQRIQVIDRDGMRILSFDGSMETRMSLRNPLQGHFGYVDLFHMAWLWNTNIQEALMIGLGGGSVVRQFQAYHPNVHLDVVELDPVVAEVARQYFFVRESTNLTVHVKEGRAYLEETAKKYDLILVDAYSRDANGSYIPPQLATKQFFELANSRLRPNGVLAYNVIGTLYADGAVAVGTIHNTAAAVFPRVYLFPAPDSLNVVVVATKSDVYYTTEMVSRRAIELVRSGRMRVPGFLEYTATFRNLPAPGMAISPILLDGPGGQPLGTPPLLELREPGVVQPKVPE